ncbi:hypothetical protein [Ammoniphilus sp. YIM 78166]|uniref:hypothetical protein n=1 Tax=Ammoniphilus sp. YIM 78166 TaxID=1644106 RepID=UPI001F0CFDEE|nr:hypothetical protein [Ammoniphilus sp. YIM 78166]
MKKRIGCLHVHHSNIEYMERAFGPYEVELIHFVEPGLIYRVSHDESFTMEAAQAKVKEQIEWIDKCGVDAILITCTNYIALLQEMSISTPIIKIDEPFFAFVCDYPGSQVLVFTNPATVNGTMERLNQFAASRGKILEIDVQVAEGAFSLIMQGDQDGYNREVSNFILELIEKGAPMISVGQLSMADAALQVSGDKNVVIGNLLDTLVYYIEKELRLDRKSNIFREISTGSLKSGDRKMVNDEN